MTSTTTPTPLRVLGAGFPRTGTVSLKLALERLLGGRCYHMTEVFDHPEHASWWVRSLDVDAQWPGVLDGYVAAVDWPAAAFWRQLSATYPDALVVLSVRADARVWWDSADATILEVARRRGASEGAGWHDLFLALLRQEIAAGWDDAETAMSAYTRHNEQVRSAVEPSRLVVWEPAEGWTPICDALSLPVPDESFPHANTRADWGVRAR